MARKGDMLRQQFHTTPTGELEAGLRCVLYEMLVLALALLQLKNRNKRERLTDPTTDEKMLFGPEQTALEAACLKSRVLLDFLYPKQKKGTNIPTNLKGYYDSLNDWAAHLTWERVRKQKENDQPKPKIVLIKGPKVLKEAIRFIEDCKTEYGYKLTPKARKYYNTFLDLNSRVGQAVPETNP